MRITLSLFCFIFFLASCAPIKDISTNTEKANEYLSKIETNTSKPIAEPLPALKDTIDLLFTRMKYDDVYSTNVIWDTSFSFTENWFKFEVHVKPDPNTDNLKIYTGFLNVATPDLLYIKDIRYITIKKSPVDSAFIHNKAKNVVIVNPRRSFTLTNLDWQKLLVTGSATFDGFEIKNRNLNFLDLQNFSFNNAFLNADTLHKSFALSPDKLESRTNSFKNTYISNSLISSASFKNWHFISDDLILADYWYNTKVYSTEFNDIVIRQIGFNTCFFENCIFRNTSYGSLKNVRFTKTIFSNSWFENAVIENSEFYGISMSGKIFNCNFTSTKFSQFGTQASIFLNMAEINGNFTNCRFEYGVVFNKSNIMFSNFNGGSFTQVNFLQDCLIRGTVFKNVDFTDVDFGLTGLWEVQFGDPTSTYTKLVTRCDFREVAWGPNVKFIKCNLIGSTFPPRAELNAKGVQFINCENEPLN